MPKEKKQELKDFDHRKQHEEKYDDKNLRWKTQPKIPKCWRGDHQQWHMHNGHYQSQLYCNYWEKYINPSGFTCKICAAQIWPTIENMRTNILPKLIEDGKIDQAQELLIGAVKFKRLTQQEGLTLAQEFFGTD